MFTSLHLKIKFCLDSPQVQCEFYFRMILIIILSDSDSRLVSTRSKQGYLWDTATGKKIFSLYCWCVSTVILVVILKYRIFRNLKKTKKTKVSEHVKNREKIKVIPLFTKTSLITRPEKWKCFNINSIK